MWGEDWGAMLWGGVPVPVLPLISLVLLTSGLLVVVAVNVQRRATRRAVTVLALAAVAISPVLATAVSVPNTFVNGTLADADEVNENFNDLATAVTALEDVEIVDVGSGGPFQIVQCPAGTANVGGGCECFSSDLVMSRPRLPGEGFYPGWHCECAANGVRTYAICQ